MFSFDEELSTDHVFLVKELKIGFEVNLATLNYWEYCRIKNAGYSF